MRVYIYPNIKRAETESLARQVAELTGESLTDAITTALSERLEHLQRRPGALSRELMAIGADCAAHLPPSLRSANFNDLLYDERGLPR